MSAAGWPPTGGIGTPGAVASVVRSWLLDLTSEALGENPSMEGIAPFAPDSGEGRWIVFEAIDLNVAAPIITNSLFRRISSRDDEEYADRTFRPRGTISAAMRSRSRVSDDSAIC